LIKFDYYFNKSDDDFNDYINYETKEATYTLIDNFKKQLMNKSFEICENANVDIYVDKLIMLPPNQFWLRC
jgi:hypothetical protein